MTDQDITIKISTDVDDSSLQSLNEELTQLQEQGVEIQIDATQADEASQGLDNATQSANEFKTELDSIDSNNVQDVGTAANNTSGELDNATGSISGTNAAAGALTGVGITAFFLEAAESAGSASDAISAIRLNLQTAGASASSIQNIGNYMTNAADDTGRSASKVRNAFQAWTAAGVTTGSTMEKLFEIGSATAFKNPSISLDGFTSSLQKSVQQGNLSKRFLTQLGTSLTEIANNAGMTEDQVTSLYESMTPDERADFLSKYVGDMNSVNNANNEFKNSWEGTKEAMSKSIGGIMRSVGEMILPILVPALQTTANILKEISSGFKWLNSVSGGAFGALVGIAGALFIFTSFAPGIKLVFDNFKNGVNIIRNLPTSISNTVSSVRNGIETIKNSVSGARSVISQNMSSIGNSVSTAGNKIGSFATTAGSKLKTLATAFADSGKQALIAAGNYVKNGLAAAANAVRTGIMTAATWLATAAQTALNFVMSINPIFLVIMAIVALVAILVYLYYNNEQVRNAVNALGAGLKFVGQLIYGYLISAWNNLIAKLTIVKTAIIGFVLGALNNLSQFPGRVWALLLQVINRVTSWGSNIVARGKSAALNFLNGVVNYFKQLPNKIYSAISGVAEKVKSVFANAGHAAWTAFVAALDSISGGLATIAINAVSGNSGSPWEVTHNNNGGYAGSPFEETSQNNNNQSGSKTGNTYIFKSLYMDKDFANHVINVIDRRDELERMRTGA